MALICGAGSYSRKLNPREVPFLPSNLSLHSLISIASLPLSYGSICFHPHSALSYRFIISTIRCSILTPAQRSIPIQPTFSTTMQHPSQTCYSLHSPKHPQHLVAGVAYSWNLALFTISVLCIDFHDAPDKPRWE